MERFFHHVVVWVRRIFYGMIFLLIILGGYWYVHPRILIGEFVLVNPFFNVFNTHYPSWLPIVDYLIGLFIVTSIIILFLVLFYVKRQNQAEKIEKQYIDEIVPLFFLFVYHDDTFSVEGHNAALKTLRKLINDEMSKQLFLTLISQVHAQTTGLVKAKTDSLFHTMRCKEWLYWNLHSPVKLRQLFALKVIAEFHLVEYSKDVSLLLKKKNYILRSEAIETLLRLHINETLLLLTGLRFALDSWNINMIIKIAIESREQELEYGLLIRQDVADISALGITLARLNHQKELKNVIRPKLDVDNVLVKDEAVLAWIDFAETRADYVLLIERFEVVSEKVQKKILKSLISCPDQTLAIDFLKRVVETKPVSLKIVALICLLDLDLNVVQTYENSEDALIRQSYLQVVSF